MPKNPASEKGLSRTRFFNDEQYRLYSVELSKEAAKGVKEELMKHGHLVRMVDDPRYGHEDHVLIYIRKKVQGSGFSLSDPRTWGW